MVNLGDEVVDAVSGFTGIVTSITNYLVGCNRIGIQPKVKSDGTLPEVKAFDEPQVKVKKANVVKANPASSTKLVNLGDEVIDTISGCKGTVIGITIWLHGCRRCAVQQKILKNGTIPEVSGFDEELLQVTKAKESKKTKKEKTGGPAYITIKDKPIV